MTLSDVLKYLEPFEALLKPELLSLEQQGADELKKLADGVSSPDLKLLLEALVVAVDTVVKAEIAKLP